MQDHIINKPCKIVCCSHMHITVVTGLGNLFSSPPPPPVVSTGSISKSVPTVMHLKVTYSTPPQHHPLLLLLLDKLRCCSPLSDLISPLEPWPTAERAGGAGECP